MADIVAFGDAASFRFRKSGDLVCSMTVLLRREGDLCGGVLAQWFCHSAARV